MRTEPVFPDFLDILRQAIRGRRALILRRQGDDGERTFEPYILHRSKAGRLMMSGHEVTQDQSVLRRAPRMVDLASLLSLRLSDHHFQPDPAFDLSERHYPFGVLCHI